MCTSSNDEREIYRKIVEFARAMDDRDWSAFANITLSEATADLGTGLLTGRDEIVRLIRSFLDECGPTQHLVGNVLIDVDGDTAHSRAYVCDTHLGTGELAQTSFRTLGDYHDDWVKVDDGWRMSHRTKHSRGAIGSITVLGPGPAGWAAQRP